jgi:hypothetical protein
VQQRRDGERRDEGEQQGVVVALRQQVLDRQRPVDAGAVLHGHRAVPARRKAFGVQAGRHVGRRARRAGADEPHRAVGPRRFGVGGPGRGREGERGREGRGGFAAARRARGAAKW